ncbi:DEAD/DEAH box helicase family protein [Oscillibacter sp.]|uniref:DEAD/DEAH box helicase family protein n=1 Tax=Oscillibacter sp. TaxID=1945593 RepID=UPI00339381E3
MEAIVLDEGGRSVKRQEIFNYFQNHKDCAERIQYLKNAYTDTSVEIDKDGVRIGYHKQDDGLLMWEGSYHARTSESVFSWAVITEMTESLMERGEYQIRLGLQNAPVMAEQLTMFDMGGSAPVYEVDDDQASIPLFSPQEVPQAVIDQALYTAGNESGSAYRVAAFYMREHPEQKSADFLCREFGEGNGRGIEYEGRKYAAWFTEDGIQLAEGNSVRTGYSRTTVTWKNASARILELLNAGTYLSPAELEQAQDKALNDMADALIYTARDLSETGRSQSFLQKTCTIYDQVHIFPDCTNALAEQARDETFLTELSQEYHTFLNAYSHSREIMRCRLMPYNTHRIESVLDGVAYPKRSFTAQPDFLRQCKMFITQDEIDHYFLDSSIDSRLLVYAHFCYPHTPKEHQNFIKVNYGEYNGGACDGYDYTKTRKGLLYQREYEWKKYDSVQFTIPQVVKEYERLIAQKRFPGEDAIAYIPQHEAEQLARTVYFGFYGLSGDIPRPYPADSDYYKAVPAIREQLADPERVQEMINALTTALDGLQEDDRYYESCAEAKRQLGEYANGTYTLFNHRYDVPVQEKKEIGVAQEETPASAPSAVEDSESSEPKEPPSQTPGNPEAEEVYHHAKEVHPDHLVAIRMGDYYELYGDDAATTAEILHSKILSRELSVGTVPTTGFLAEQWAANMKALWRTGHNVLLIDQGDNGQFYAVKQRLASDYIPIHSQIQIEGRRFEVESVNSEQDKVSLRDVTFQNSTGFPIMRTEPIEFVRSYIEEPEPSVEGLTVVLPEQGEEDANTTLSPPMLKKERRISAAAPLYQQGINYRITDDTLGAGTPSERYANNVAAIRLLQKMDKEGYPAAAEDQEVLARYVGWGGLADCFDEKNSKYNELKSLLSDTEYASARESTLTAFYTPPVVIRSIYQALANMGFAQGNILEPACGTGNFFGLLPESMAGSKLYGVELDDVSGRIARQLYQRSSVSIQGFEKAQFSDNFFDVAIGNVPFGQFKVADRRYDRLNLPIHEYFIAKTLDKVRPGGVVAFVTSSYTMDKRTSNTRKYIAQRAELLGAVRLPNNAFKAAAGTEVVSDILFLQKRDHMVDIEPEWVHLATDDNGIQMNSYFIDHPDMVLGEMKMVSGPFGPEPTFAPYPHRSLDELLSTAIQNIHAEITDYDREEKQDGEDKSLEADPAVRNFSYTVVDGQIYFRENSRMNPVEVSKTAESRIRGLIDLRDCVRSLIEYQTEDYPEEDIKAQQASLNTIYDTFTRHYGLINSRGNSLAFSEDSSYFLLCSLENIDENGNLESKADLFTKRTIRFHKPAEKVDTAVEALALSIGEKARVDMEYMGQLTGKNEEELFADLRGVVFLNPDYAEGVNEKYLPADEYLSGNVRQKLVIADERAKIDPQFQINADALTRVQPVDLTPGEISVRLGATWLNPDYIRQFAIEALDSSSNARRNMKIHYSKITGEWRIEGKNLDFGNVKVYSTYGTKRINAYEIIEDSLNLKDVRIFDYIDDAEGHRKPVLNKKETAIAQSKQELIKEAFSEWIWKAPDRRETICKSYNILFNSNRPREYDGSHISFSGMNQEITLRPHQVNAIAHVMYGGNTLLAHVVGAGKTFEMVAAAMESKRLGLCQKSLFVVPNHLTEQWATDFLQLYPAANILVATKKDFETKNRKRFCGRIATGDYDAVIIGHSQFEKIPMSAERQRTLLEQQRDEILLEISDAKRDKAENFTIKQMEKTRKGIETKIEKLNDQSRKDDVVTFEELGTDRLFVDESHFYKNLFLYTKMRNVSGIAQTEAQKSSDLFMKCRYLDELTGGRGIVFATGTPISNSMVELYTIQRYLQMKALQEQGLQHFDSWAANYGETVTAIELSPEGSGYRAKTRFAKFYNLPELMSVFKNVADIQTADMLKLPVPKAHYHNIALQPSEFQKAEVANFATRAERVRNRMVDSSEDNMLLITNDGRKLALDQRLINPMLPDDPYSKASKCADNTFEIWQRTAAQRSTQMIFCDLSTPSGPIKMEVHDGSAEMTPFQNVYWDIYQKLTEKGIPDEEIAFIHNAKSEAQKKDLFAKVRSGQVRILLGSTQRMGAGTNCQHKLIALHHVDCPWRPSDLQQREGRIIRQGNENPDVDIYSYVTEGTFDAYLYQLVESKQRFISQIMTSKSPVRSAEDIDETALSYAEIKALASGNPQIKEKMDLDVAVSKLKLLKGSHLSQKYALEDAIAKQFPRDIMEQSLRIAAYTDDQVTIRENTHLNEDGFSPMTLAGKTYADKKTAGSALLELCQNMVSPEAVPAGSYRGLNLELSYDTFSKEFRMALSGKIRHLVPLGTDALGNIQRLDNALGQYPAKEQSCRERLEKLQRQLDTAKVEVQKPFAKELELQQKTERLEELNALLNLDEKELVEEPDADETQRLSAAAKQMACYAEIEEDLEL